VLLQQLITILKIYSSFWTKNLCMRYRLY